MPDRSNQMFAAAALRILGEAGYKVALSRDAEDIIISGLMNGPWKPELVQCIAIDRRHGTVPISDITPLLQAADTTRKA